MMLAVRIPTKLSDAVLSCVGTVYLPGKGMYDSSKENPFSLKKYCTVWSMYANTVLKVNIFSPPLYYTGIYYQVYTIYRKDLNMYFKISCKQ